MPLSAAGGGGVFAIFRTDQHHLGAATTSDPTGATGWSASHAASFWDATPAAAALSAFLRNPRGPITVRRMTGGRWLMLWYNSGGGADMFFERNPYWLSIGVENAARREILFSQPEIFLYDALHQGDGENGTISDRPGYPDIVVDENARSVACPTCTVFVTETNKTVARTHGIPSDFLNALLAQDTIATATTAGVTLTFNVTSFGTRFKTPIITPFSPVGSFQAGFTVEFWLDRWTGGNDVVIGQTLVDTRAPSSGAGFIITVSAPLNGGTGVTLSFLIRDDVGTTANLTLDGKCASLVGGAAALHHVVFTIDAAAHIALAVVDGFVCDGGLDKWKGWTWISNKMSSVTANDSFIWGGDYGGNLVGGRWYNRAISVTESIGNQRAGPP